MGNTLLDKIEGYLGRKVRELINVYQSELSIPNTIINGAKPGKYSRI